MRGNLASRALRVPIEPLDLALDALAVHRLTRLVTADSITRPMRALAIGLAYEPADTKLRIEAMNGSLGSQAQVDAGWITWTTDREWEDRALADDDAPMLAELVTCRWCAGMWVALGVAVVRRTRWWRAMRVVLALSSLGVLIAGAETA